MGLSDNLKGGKDEKNTPNNNRLLLLLSVYESQQGSQESYMGVLSELLNGNSYLLLPTVNKDKTEGWKNIEKDDSLQITSVFDMEGLKVLGAFTDEMALLKWADRETQYTAIPSKDVLDMCENNGIGRIVINSGQSNMFVLERNRGNIQTQTLTQNTDVLLGMPNEPLSNEIVERLKNSFSKVEIIQEAYQYGQSIGSDFNIVIGFRIANYTENAKKATMDAVSDGLKDVEISHAIDLFFLEDEKFYGTIKNLEGSLIYSKD